jgi:hypothetical protein
MTPAATRTLSAAATVLGSLTIPGRAEHVSQARTFVGALSGADDTAALLTSELVTNAVVHTRSGRDGGTVTVVVINVPGSLVVEVVDDGTAGDGPQVRGDRFAAQGHGLFLVEQLAADWGFLKDAAGTTVWFRIEIAPDAAPPA